MSEDLLWRVPLDSAPLRLHPDFIARNKLFWIEFDWIKTKIKLTPCITPVNYDIFKDLVEMRTAADTAPFARCSNAWSTGACRHTFVDWNRWLTGMLPRCIVGCVGFFFFFTKDQIWNWYSAVLWQHQSAAHVEHAGVGLVLLLARQKLSPASSIAIEVCCVDMVNLTN